MNSLADSFRPAFTARSSSEGWLRAGALVGGFLILFAMQPYAAGYGDLRKTLLQVCWDAWFNPQDGTWQHGAIVPFVSVWLIWQRRHELERIEWRSEPWGLGVCLVALLVYYVGFKAHNYYLGAASLMMLLGGGIIWLFGRQMMGKLLFPWSLLVFLWPLRFLEDTLGFELRFLMVRLVGAVLDAVGAPILRDGTTLISAVTDSQPQGAWLRLNIEGPCSGMRSLFALMMVSALYSYHRTRSWWQRTLLMLLSLPFAVLGNMIRIFLLIIGSALFGQAFAVGNEEVETSAFHFVAGVMVFIVAVLALEGTASLLKKFTRGPGT